MQSVRLHCHVCPVLKYPPMNARSCINCIFIPLALRFEVYSNYCQRQSELVSGIRILPSRAFQAPLRNKSLKPRNLPTFS